MTGRTSKRTTWACNACGRLWLGWTGNERRKPAACPDKRCRSTDVREL